ncbi:MAG: RagB/SusD family nutrient uptake outer membrane protein [Chitinophagaceae bacterium]
MKRINIIRLLFAATLLFAVSCSKFLERKPEGQETQEEALNDEAGVAAFLNGNYTYLADNDFMGGRVQVVSELLGDEYKGDKFTGDYAEIYKRQNSIFGATRDDLYKKGYKVISASNIVLDNLGKASSDAVKNSFEGQAKFFRGVAHFELVRLFAQPYGYTAENSHLGIPLRINTSVASVQRSTVQQVYDQIIADLKRADTLLPDNTDNGKFYTASKWAAKAYLAKVYFQMNRFTEAYAYADAVIKSGKFQLDANYTDRFSLGNSKEPILRIANEVNHFTPGGGLRDNFRSDKGIPGMNFTDFFYTYATTKSYDVRKAWYSNTLQAGYNVLTKYNKDYFELPIVHLTEIKLIRAEAGAELGGANVAGAITDINDILTRAYGSTTYNLPTSASASAVISTTRSERELEMVGEGNRVQEIKRIGARSGSNVDRRGSPWNCNGFILQFPKAEQDANASFVMNVEGGCF